MPSYAYLAGRSVETPDYSGELIDAQTPEELAAELHARATADGAEAQQAVNTEALSALSAAKADILGLQQRQDYLSEQLEEAALLQQSAEAAASEALQMAVAASEAAAAVPAVDVASVARLASEVQEYGVRTVNQAAQAQVVITELATNTTEQVEALRSEVVSLQGSATSVVEGIQQASQAALSDALERVGSLLADTPEQVRQTILNVLGDVEFVVDGQLDPQDKYTWQWRWARMKDPETITRVSECPVYVGWRGEPGKSGSPLVGGGGGGGTGNLYLQADLQPSVEMPLKIQDRTNTALGGRDFKGPALVKFTINEANAPDNWVVGTLDLGAALNAPGPGVFTVAAELQGPGTPPEFTFRVEQLGAGVNSAIALWVTCTVPAEFLGTFIEIQP